MPKRKQGSQSTGLVAKRRKLVPLFGNQGSSVGPVVRNVLHRIHKPGSLIPRNRKG